MNFLAKFDNQFNRDDLEFDNYRQNQKELLEYVIQRYKITKEDLEDSEKFKTIMREIKINDIICANE